MFSSHNKILVSATLRGGQQSQLDCQLYKIRLCVYGHVRVLYSLRGNKVCLQMCQYNDKPGMGFICVNVRKNIEWKIQK